MSSIFKSVSTSTSVVVESTEQSCGDDTGRNFPQQVILELTPNMMISPHQNICKYLFKCIQNLSQM